MPFISPTPGDVHVSRPLTQIMVGYMQAEEGFVADSVFPNIPVQKQADAYFTYDRGDWNRDDMEVRAPGAESAGSAYDIGQASYYAPVLALHKDIPDQLRANADSPLDLDRDATLFVTNKARLRREIGWAAKYFVTGVWAFNTSGVVTGQASDATFVPDGGANSTLLRWNDAASDPIKTIRRAMTQMQQRTGYRPNTLVLGRPVYDILVDHPAFIARMDRGQTNGAAKANRDAMAAILDLAQVIVMDGIVNSAKKGSAEANSFIGGKNALLVYAAPNPSVLMPSAGYTFSWQGYLGATTNGARIKRIRAELISSDRVEIEMAYDQRLIGSELGYFFGNIVN